MSTLPPDIENSRLWRETLATQPNDPFAAHRERFRTVFPSFRERAGHLASQIRQDCPLLTVHDLTHLDALWEIASIIVGEKYALTPTEGFVLGGAILLHDLAMSVAAIEGGYKKLKQDVRWGDLVTHEYRSQFGRDPNPRELLEPVREVEQKTVFNLLRQIHAEKAEQLALLSFSTSGGNSLYVIEDTEIRQSFGRIVGQIAHSHWWLLTEVEQRFSRTHGAPPWPGCPPEWTVDPLKIACILRCADAAHLDARRAPIFLRSISKLPPSSEIHWKFQERLNKPYLNEDSLT